MEFKGKTVEEAVKKALEELGLKETEATVEIIAEPKKGLFGRLKGEAIVDVKSVREEEPKKESKKVEKEEKKEDKKDKKEQAKKAKKEQNSGKDDKEFLSKVLEYLGITAEISESQKDGKTIYTVESKDSSFLIGHRGEVIDAIQTIVGAKANIGEQEYKKIVVDCENYRQKREDTLISLAKRLEQKATEMRREVILEPMSPYERRIIHTALSESETVKTESQGVEPNRYVVIIPNDKDEFSRPYNAARNNDHGRGGRNNKNNFKKGGQRNDRPKKSGFIEQRKKPSLTFGTYLGNSLKDDK